MMKSWTFGKKLGAGFSLVVLLSIVIVVVAMLALNQVVQRSDGVVNVAAENLIDAQALKGATFEKMAAVRGSLLTASPIEVQEAFAGDEAIPRIIVDIRTRGLRQEAAHLLAAVEQAAAAYEREVEAVVRMAADNAAPADIAAYFEAQVEPAAGAFHQRVEDFVVQERAVLDEGTADLKSDASMAKLVIMAFGVGAVVLAALLAAVLGRSLAQQIGLSVQHVRSSSAELQAAASQQASGAKEQATAMSEISTTITELLATSRQIAESAQRVAKVAEQTAQGADAGNDAVKAAHDSMTGIKNQVETIVNHMVDLGKKSQQIGGILELINEFAEQTNIVAINATIEASGAGENGRRFAAVGDEVRRLSDRVSGSAKEIRQLVQEIREAVNASVMATEAGAKTVDAGGERVMKLTELFDQIGQQVEITTEVAREIELSTKQQATAVEQVNVAISDVAQATRESEAGSSQTFQTASQLATLSRELVRLVQPAEPERA